MKRIITMILCAALLMVPLAPAAAAETVAEAETQTQYFEDGSYITVGFCENSENEATLTFISRLINLIKELVALLQGQRSVSKTKYADYYDAKGRLLWRVCLSADFLYNGKEAKCTQAKTSYEIYDSDWKLISRSDSKNEAKANGSFSLRQYKLGVPLKVIEKTLTLVCSADGRVS